MKFTLKYDDCLRGGGTWSVAGSERRLVQVTPVDATGGGGSGHAFLAGGSVRQPFAAFNACN